MNGSELEMINSLANAQQESEETTQEQGEAQEQEQVEQEQTSEEAGEQQQEEAPQQEEQSSLTQPQQEEAQAPEETKETETEAEAPSLDIKEWIKENSDNIRLLNQNFDQVDLEDTNTVHDYLLEKYVSDGYSREDALIMLEGNFPTFYDDEADDEDEDVIRKSNREFVKMKNEAKQYVDELKSKQAELNLDFPIDEGYDKQIISRYEEKLKENYDNQLTQAREANANLAKSITSEINELKFDDGEGGEFTYQLSKEDQELFTKEFTDYNTFFDRNFGDYDKDGNLVGVKKEELVKAVIVAKKLPEIIKIAMNTGGGKGRKEQLNKDFKNSTISGGNKPPRESQAGNDVISQGVKILREGGQIFK